MYQHVKFKNEAIMEEGRRRDRKTESSIPIIEVLAEAIPVTRLPMDFSIRETTNSIFFLSQFWLCFLALAAQ